jgi:hypothetical protein
MKRTLRWALIGSLIAAVFGGGFLLGILSHFGDRLVRVDVANHTDTPIRTVTISHEHGTATASGIEPGTIKRLEFFAPGETSFRTTVELANGRQLEGQELYTEAGYRITVTVSEKGIEVHHALYGRAS